jgi:hypothetical protein
MMTPAWVTRVHLPADDPPHYQVEVYDDDASGYASSDDDYGVTLEMMYGDWNAVAAGLVTEAAHPDPEPAPEPVSEADAAASLPGENILTGQFIEADPDLAQLTEEEVLNIQSVDGEMVTSAAAADIEEDSLPRLALTRTLMVESRGLLEDYDDGPDPHGGDSASSDDSWLGAHGSYIYIT